jgi:hypothetical protein
MRRGLTNSGHSSCGLFTDSITESIQNKKKTTRKNVDEMRVMMFLVLLNLCR